MRTRSPVRTQLNRLLRRRGQTVTSIARAAGVSRAHLSLIFANRPGRGHQVRPKVALYLTDDEKKLLGWTEFLIGQKTMAND